MKNLQTYLASVSLFLASSSEGKTLQGTCLTFNDHLDVLRTGQYMSNENELTQMDSHTRLHSIRTCSDHDYDDVVGIQLFMSQTYRDIDTFQHAAFLSNEEDANEFHDSSEVERYNVQAMDPIGEMNGNCETIELPVMLDRITVSKNNQFSSFSIAYEYTFIGHPQSFAYGAHADELDDLQVDSSTAEWTFSGQDPLVGLYGW